MVFYACDCRDISKAQLIFQGNSTLKGQRVSVLISIGSLHWVCVSRCPEFQSTKIARNMGIRQGIDPHPA